MSKLVRIDLLLGLFTVTVLLVNAGCSMQNQKLPQSENPVSELQIRQDGSHIAPDAHQLCYEYLYGADGVQPSHVLAYKWCSKGAAIGVPDSQVLLAEMYLTGDYLKHDVDRALRWYLAAAEQNHQHAQYMIYHLYVTQGKRIQSNYEPEYWLYQSANQGYQPAIDALLDVAVENNKN